VPWHAHHGMEILSYMVEGCGRHADSMGNRETFASPGFQWMSVGSGIEHAEGGGTPRGQRTHGFQIWLRMPKSRMGDAPRYGTVQPEEIPTVQLPAGQVRVIAKRAGRQGGWRTCCRTTCCNMHGYILQHGQHFATCRCGS
jgi:redox-sensitive bicupin YhaK (pirin superfamily)